MTNCWYLSYFPQKLGSDISCKLSPLICIKCQRLYYAEKQNKQKYLQIVVRFNFYSACYRLVLMNNFRVWSNCQTGYDICQCHHLHHNRMLSSGYDACLIQERIFFLFLHKNICFGYSLEAPRRGASNEYHNICFRDEIRQIIIN